ncbi:MAG: alpha/beta fold hydrolase [Terriglobus roseus]|nr:alpha/beta fold hydrolase [Terriglobus roseus]
MIGDDPNWVDHTRDLFHFINTFQRHMPPPIIGIGESWGAAHFVTINTWHPRLLAGILLLDPALGPGHRMKGRDYENTVSNWPSKLKYWPGAVASRRPDRWASREEAVKHLSRSRFYSDMDAEARQKALEHDLRDVTDSTGTYVTLATPKYVEAQLWGRPQPPLSGLPPYPLYEQPSVYARVVPGFDRVEGPLFHEAITRVTCPVKFLFGGKSFLAQLPDYKEAFIRRTGSADGAGGGETTGQASYDVVEKAGHNIVMHRPRAAAELSVPWIAEAASKWMEDYEARRTGRKFEKGVSADWMQRIRDLQKHPDPETPGSTSKL